MPDTRGVDGGDTDRRVDARRTVTTRVITATMGRMIVVTRHVITGGTRRAVSMTGGVTTSTAIVQAAAAVMAIVTSKIGTASTGTDTMTTATTKKGTHGR